MTHVICEPCDDCKYTDCVAVCPVDCFWQDERMLYIDPMTCIDCEAGIPECPVDAIFIRPNRDFGRGVPPEPILPSGEVPGNVPPAWHHYIRLNVERATALKEAGKGHITRKGDPQQGPECKKK